MRKILRKTICLLAVFVMVMAANATSFASSVTYKGQAEKFVFAPGSEYSLTDLFTDFKGVMPGDQLTQQITVRNDASNDVKVKLYMRSLGASDLQSPEDGIAEVSAAESADFLKEMNLTVKQNGDSILFDAPADVTDGLTDWVCLGTFYSGAEVDLTVTLDVPITMGNDFQQRIGALDWQFMVEEFPIEKDDPKTGDNMNFVLPICIMAAAGLGAILLFARRRRQER